MIYKIFVPSALDIYKVGISCLMDSNWIQNQFKNLLEQHLIYKNKPNNLIRKTISHGLLYVLGLEFVDLTFLSIKDDILRFNVATAYEKLDNFLLFLVQSGLPFSGSILELYLTYDDIDEIIVTVSEKRANSVFYRKQLHLVAHNDIHSINQQFKEGIAKIRRMYALNYAERVFHDRELCEYIAYVVAALYDYKGFPCSESNNQCQLTLVSRRSWPSWVLPTLRAREREKCAKCHKSFSELESEFHIDHIIPLSKGGFNDIVNLQLLCEECNLKKSAEIDRVTSSIPKYFKWHKSMKNIESTQ